MTAAHAPAAHAPAAQPTATASVGARALKPAALRERLAQVDWVLRLVGEVAVIGLLMLGLRIYLFDVFFNSGWLKLTDIENNMILFTDADFGYNMGEVIPFLPVSVSYWLATLAEVLASILVLIGLYTRYAAVPLFAVAVVIQFVLAGDYQLVGEFLWLFAASLVIAVGPGVLSLDALRDHLLGRPVLPARPARP